MKFLLDTNVFPEVALDQERAEEAARSLQSGEEGLFGSDLSLYSPGIHLFCRRLTHAYTQLMMDVFVSEAAQVVSLPVQSHAAVAQAVQSHGLDFEDAYQLCVAKHFGLSLVSFDADFGRTDLKRMTPAKALASLGA